MLGAHLAGEAVETRGFDREDPLRAMNDADLSDALHERMATLTEVAAAADAVPADTDVAWTGRTMKVQWFAEPMREELVLHGRDVTGDCGTPAAARAALSEPWMTTHSVVAVGRPLLAKGAKELRRGGKIEARLRVRGSPDRRRRAGKAAVGSPFGRPVADLQPCRTADPEPGPHPAQRLLTAQ